VKSLGIELTSVHVDDAVMRGKRSKKVNKSTTNDIPDENETISAVKRPKLGDITNVINNPSAVHANVVMDAERVKPELVVKTTHKIVLTSEEQGMNGAPESDLYDVKVLSNDDISPCSAESLQCYLQTVTGVRDFHALVWVEKFDLITMIRQILKHQSDMIKLSHLPMISTFIIEGVDSLRSTTVRNSLEAMKQLVLFSTSSATHDQAYMLGAVQCILRKTSTAPKFMISLVDEIIQVMTKNLSLHVLLPAANEFVNHKNLDSVKKSFSMICDAIKLTDCNGDKLILNYLCVGVKSKSPEARKICKEAIVNIQNMLGDSFESYVTDALSESDVAFLRRELMQKTVAKLPSKFAPHRNNSTLIRSRQDDITVYEDSLLTSSL
jgi:hypothetical protein